MKKKTKIVLGIAALVVVAAIIIYSKLTASLPDDGANAKMAHHTNTLDNRYLEVFVIGGNYITGHLKANCYNTEGYNVNPIPGDFAPQNLVDKLNADEIKKEYKALGAFINGPRRWCLDWIDIPTGVERDFSGLKAPWVATLLLKRGQKGKVPFETGQIERKSAFGINKGTTVFLLDDPAGRTFVMKSYSLVLDSTMTREKVPEMMAKIKFPSGWKYRVKVLDQDLVLIPESGVCTIVPDDSDNVYDLTGPGFSNYKP